MKSNQVSINALWISTIAAVVITIGVCSLIGYARSGEPMPPYRLAKYQDGNGEFYWQIESYVLFGYSKEPFVKKVNSPEEAEALWKNFKRELRGAESRIVDADYWDDRKDDPPDSEQLPVTVPGMKPLTIN